jgi:hypothetical protein
MAFAKTLFWVVIVTTTKRDKRGKTKMLGTPF